MYIFTFNTAGVCGSKAGKYMLTSTEALQYIQGGAVNRGLKYFFSLYRPLHLLEAYVWPEKYLWCGLDPWLTIHSILTSFFLATAQRRWRKERHVWLICTAASRHYSAATNGRRAAKFA
jgi:hypothetical protein